MTTTTADAVTALPLTRFKPDAKRRGDALATGAAVKEYLDIALGDKRGPSLVPLIASADVLDALQAFKVDTNLLRQLAAAAERPLDVATRILELDPEGWTQAAIVRSQLTLLRSTILANAIALFDLVHARPDLPAAGTSSFTAQHKGMKSAFFRS